MLARAGAEFDRAERDAVWAAGAAATYTEVLETVVSALADAREAT